jgi:nicotinamide riboside kinase
MKIGFCGTISVGKTTLVNALKELPEFADYHFATERSKYLRDLGIPLNTDSTLKGQLIFLAERASELLHENMITDRTVIDVMAFSHLSTTIPFFISADLNKAVSELIRDYDYIFYVSPEGVELEDNGVRVVDSEYRMELDQTIKNLLEQHKFKFNTITGYAELSGTTEERIQKIKQVMSL